MIPPGQTPSKNEPKHCSEVLNLVTLMYTPKEKSKRKQKEPHSRGNYRYCYFYTKCVLVRPESDQPQANFA